MTAPSRRQFMGFLAGVAGAGGLSTWIWGTRSARNVRLRSEFLVGLGRRYLDSAPEDGDRQLLQRVLGIEDSGMIPVGRTRRRIQQEFRRGDIVLVDGWYLARSEARLYALLSLL